MTTKEWVMARILGFRERAESRKGQAPPPKHGVREGRPPDTVAALQSTLGNRELSRLARAGDSSAAFEDDGEKKGQPLQSHVRSAMESALGADFSGVRVRTDAEAAGTARQLGAKAFTVGDEITFAEGRYRPGTPLGDALIAHELAHVVQQQGGGGTASEAALEGDANAAAAGSLAKTWNQQTHHQVGQSAPRLRSGLRLQMCSDDAETRAQAQAAFEGVVSGVLTGRQQPIPVPMPDPRVAQGMLDLQYGALREDFVMWQSQGARSPKFERMFGTNYVDWDHYMQYGETFGEIWPHFLSDAWNNTIVRASGGGGGEGSVRRGAPEPRGRE